MADLTPGALYRLAELRAKGTPGEWWAWDRGVGFELAVGPDRDSGGRPSRFVPQGLRTSIERRADAELIVAAVNALPALVEEVRQLRVANDHNEWACEKNQELIRELEAGDHPHLYTYEQHRADHHNGHTCPEDDWKACVRDAGLARIAELEAERDRARASAATSNRIHMELIEQINDALGLDPDDDETCVPGCEDGPAGSAHSLWHLIQHRDQATAEVRAKELEDAADAEPGWPVKPWLRARAARIRGEQP